MAGLLLAGTAQAQTPAPAGGKAELQWFAQSAFKLTTPRGKVIMIDPWLTANPKTPPEFKDLDKLGKIDLILVSHGHGDHFGDSVELAKKNNVPVLGTAGMGQTLQVLGILPPALSVRMNKSGTIQPFDGVKIRQMGDTGLFSDMKFIADYYKPDLVLIPIGGHFVMNPKDAAYAISQWIKPKKVMPMHYGTSPFLKGTPEEFKAALGNAPVEVIVMQPGEKTTF